MAWQDTGLKSLMYMIKIRASEGLREDRLLGHTANINQKLALNRAKN